MEIEELAKVLHEAGREAVEKGKLVNNSGQPFLEWDEISEDAKEGRRIQARYLLKRYTITERTKAKSENNFEKNISEAYYKLLDQINALIKRVDKIEENIAKHLNI